jgi:putative membrane protein
MTELMIWYEWIRAAHIISVICWMAGLLYLPRLFVYHSGVKPGSEASETFKVMERKLLRIIMNPALVSSWLFGSLLLLANPALLYEPWMLVKLVAVVVLTGIHYVFARWVKVFASDANTRSSKFYRYMNEVPTVLMLVIVIMAVAEPF